jgi:PAS domain S-box-containing protein
MLDSHTSEADFQLLANHAPVMIWRSGRDGLYDWFNEPWLAFTGRTVEQEFGTGWTEGLLPEDRPRYEVAYARAFAAREPFTIEYRLRRRDGVYRWLLDSGRPFFRRGEFAGYVGSSVDVTEHRETEDRLRSLLTEREELLREVHHRVNNNLQTLTALIRLRGRTADPDGRSLLNELNRRVLAMAAVQRYLHNLDSMAEVSVREFLTTVLQEVSPLEATAQIRLEPGRDDVSVNLNKAANAGLAAAEAVGLLLGADADEPLHGVSVAVDGERLAVVVRGIEQAGSDPFARQLIRAYARAAGATVGEHRNASGETSFVIGFDKEGGGPA